MRHLLSIAGSDCSGGAGIQADLKTFSALGTYGMSVITSVVAENTARVVSVHDIPEQVVADQIDAVFEDIRVDAVKIGMLSNAGIARVVAERLLRYRPAYIVLDPVMVATSGGTLMHEETLRVLSRDMLPLADIVTPNIPEAEALTGMNIHTPGEMAAAAEQICRLGAKSVLVKGGHLPGRALDALCDGGTIHLFECERINTTTTHGTGCTLSSAIAVFLAEGLNPAQAVKAAKKYVTEAIRNGLDIGKGHGPTNHFYRFNQKGMLK